MRKEWIINPRTVLNGIRHSFIANEKALTLYHFSHIIRLLFNLSLSQASSHILLHSGSFIWMLQKGNSPSETISVSPNAVVQRFGPPSFPALITYTYHS
jgi:hypothetical protein